MQRPRLLTTPLLLVTAALVAAGGYVHLREWLEIYRDIPSSVPGSAVVRIGFPLNAAVSFVLALVLVALAVGAPRSNRVTNVVLGATALFQAASLASLILSRTGSVFGWSEAIWTPGADQTRAVEIGALFMLVGIIAIQAAGRRRLVPARTDWS